MSTDTPLVVYLGREASPGMIDALKDEVHVLHLPDVSVAASQLVEIGPRVQGVITSASVGVTADILDLMPNLEVVSSFGVGVDAVDLAYLEAKRIHLGYTPDVLNDCVADLTLGLMLDVTRAISQNDRYVREAKWTHASAPLAVQTSKKRVGFYGMGRIGQEIAQRCVAFKMPIAYYTRTAKAELPYLYIDSLKELARWSDILVVIVPATASTQNSVNTEVLEALGDQGYLINVARGSIINENDLLFALEQKRIAGAGLDVFYNEPAIDPRFLSLENVVLSPHAGSATHETRQAMGELTVNNLLHYFKNGRLLSPYFAF